MPPTADELTYTCLTKKFQSGRRATHGGMEPRRRAIQCHGPQAAVREARISRLGAEHQLPGRFQDAVHALAAGATRDDVRREFFITWSQVKEKYGAKYKHVMRGVRKMFTAEFSAIWELNERIKELTPLQEDGATTTTTPTPQAWTWRTGSVRLTQGRYTERRTRVTHGGGTGGRSERAWEAM